MKEEYAIKIECEHIEILFNKELDCNYCANCRDVFYDDITVIRMEEERMVDNLDENLRLLNEL